MKEYYHSRFHSGAFLALILLNLTLLGYVVLGGRGGGQISFRPQSPGPHAPSQARKFIQKELGMTDSQILAFDSLREAHSLATRIARIHLGRAKEDLYHSLSSLPEEKDSKIQQLNDAYMELEKLNYEHFSSLHQLLDSVQQVKLKSMIIEILRNTGPGRRGRPGGGAHGGFDGRLGPGGGPGHGPPPNRPNGQGRRRPPWLGREGQEPPP